MAKITAFGSDGFHFSVSFPLLPASTNETEMSLGVCGRALPRGGERSSPAVMPIKADAAARRQSAGHNGEL